MKSPALFRNKKAGNTGIAIFFGVIIFEIIMYFFIYAANSDTQVTPVGSATSKYPTPENNMTSSSEVSATHISSWYDGFKISIFGLPWWANLIYVTMMTLLFIVSLYAMLRGLN